MAAVGVGVAVGVADVVPVGEGVGVAVAPESGSLATGTQPASRTITSAAIGAANVVSRLGRMFSIITPAPAIPLSEAP